MVICFGSGIQEEEIEVRMRIGSKSCVFFCCVCCVVTLVYTVCVYVVGCWLGGSWLSERERERVGCGVGVVVEAVVVV